MLKTGDFHAAITILWPEITQLPRNSHKEESSRLDSNFWMHYLNLGMGGPPVQASARQSGTFFSGGLVLGVRVGREVNTPPPPPPPKFLDRIRLEHKLAYWFLSAIT